MKNRELSNQITSINALFDKAAALREEPEMMSHWAKYCCIIVSGFIENAIKILFTEYIKKTANPKTAQFASFYINDKIFSIKNPDTEKIGELLRRFDESFKTSFDNFIATNILDVAVNSIKGNRNKIAHGGYMQSSLSMVSMKEFYKGSVKVMEFIENLLFPAPVP